MQEVRTRSGRWLAISLALALGAALAVTATGVGLASAPYEPVVASRNPVAASWVEWRELTVLNRASATTDNDPQLFDDAVIHDLQLTFDDDNWLGLLGCERGMVPGPAPAPSDDVPAVLIVDGVRLEDVGVHCKGNSSLSISGTKKPLNITTDAFVPGQRLWGFDVINLDNGWGDPSQVRTAVALRFLREYLPAQRFSFARVTVQSAYIGMYTVSEQVNGEFADHWFPGDDGYAVKGDSPNRIVFNSSTLEFLGESLDAYKQAYQVKGPMAAFDDGYVAVRELTRALDAPAASGGLDDDAFPDGILDQLDVETALWYLASSNLLANFDSYYVGKNYFLYDGGRDPRFHLIPWDLSLAFGAFGFQNGQPGRPGGGTDASRVDPFAQSGDGNRPLIRRLLAVPAYRADYVAHYRAMLDGFFNREWLESIGSQYQDLVREAVRAEEEAQGRISGAYTFAQFEDNLQRAVSGGLGGRGGSTPGILSLADDRRAYVLGLSDFRSPDIRLEGVVARPGEPTVADEVAIEASFAGADTVDSVEMRYRVDGGAERGVAMNRTEAGYRATIPAQRQGSRVTYVLRVGLADGRAAFFPAETLTKPLGYEVAGLTLPEAEAGDLVINELMADNEAAIADEAGEFDDWVELYNRGEEPIDLSGFYLSDDVDDPWAYALPPQALDAGQRLLIWCDNDPEQGADHADFALSRDGESVYLSTTDATVDKVDFGPLLADESLMRLPDGHGEWTVCSASTPREPNACAPDAQRTPETPAPTPSATGATPGVTPTPGTATESPTPSRTMPAATAPVTPTGGTPSSTPVATSTPPWAGKVYLPVAVRPIR